MSHVLAACAWRISGADMLRMLRKLEAYGVSPSAAGRSCIVSTGEFHSGAAATSPAYAICPTMYTISSPYLQIQVMYPV